MSLPTQGPVPFVGPGMRKPRSQAINKESRWNKQQLFVDIPNVLLVVSILLVVVAVFVLCKVPIVFLVTDITLESASCLLIICCCFGTLGTSASRLIQFEHNTVLLC
jgi:hypothetical protein